MNSVGWTTRITDLGKQLLPEASLDVQAVFDDPRIVVWRNLPERQNCYLDVPGQSRLHIKRYQAPHGNEVEAEVRAIELLANASIPTVPLLAWGTHADGRGFLISEDLAGYQPADRVLNSAAGFERFATRIAELAGKLHHAKLHHRDLYLCHFFIKPDDSTAPVHLIDPGRVARLPSFPMNIRWIVKDLAQLVYSSQEIGLSSDHIGQMLRTYFAHAHIGPQWLIRRMVPLKVASIARHDRRIREKRPGRRVSIDHQA